MEENRLRDPDAKDAADLSQEEERRLGSVVDVFSRLSVACKSRTLYPAEHPSAVDSILFMHTVMEDALEMTGDLTVKVSRNSLTYEGWAIGPRMENLRTLASRIRSLDIKEIWIKADASRQDAESLVELLVSDPEDLVAAGGPEAFMLARGAYGIGVVETAAGRAETENAQRQVGSEVAEEPAPDEGAKQDISSPKQVSDLLALLLDPEELGKALMALRGKNGRPLTKEELADAAFEFLKAAAAIVEREYPERRQDCMRCVAESLLFLDRDVRNHLLVRSMLPKLREEPICRDVLEQFSAREMADVLSLFLPLVPELTPKIKSLLKLLGFDKGEAQNTLGLLQARLLDLGEIPHPLIASLEIEAGGGESGQMPSRALPSLEEITEVLGEGYSPEEMDEIQVISESDPAVDLMAESTPMLIDMLEHAETLNNLDKVVELLQQNFWGLTMSARLDIAASVLKRASKLLEEGGQTIEPFRPDLVRMLEEAAGERAMQRTIQLACSRRDDPRTADGLKSYMGELGRKGVAAMVEALGAEEEMSVRKYIVDVLTELCQDRISLLGAYVNDPRWYLVRNIVTIMARIHSPETIPFLRSAFSHPHPKVRAETIRALGLTGGQWASELLMQGLEDDDEKTRVLCIRWLGRLGETYAVGRLVDMLEGKAPGAESLPVKKEIILSLGEIAAQESYGVLKKYQNKQKRLNRAEWQDINNAASEALQRLNAKFPYLERKR